MALFGTNGVRGKLDVLTPGLAFDLASSFASLQKGKELVLAMDMRKTSSMMHSAAKAGILSAGKDVLDLGLASSPVSEYFLSKSPACGLIIVTASHNAPEWNALKFVDENGVAISRERGVVIEKMALAKNYSKAGWKTVGKTSACSTATHDHSSAVLKAVDSEKIRKKNLKIALDFGNGTSVLSKKVFESLGCEIVLLNGKLDGTFPGRPSEPSEQNVQELCKEVAKESADFGVAWDGDSDRVIFVDEKGKWIVGDKGFAISAKKACKEDKGKEKFVVTTVATSRAVEEACKPFGAKTVYTKVGAPYLSEKMHELGKKAASGGEEVGGIIWPGFSIAKDGIFAAAKIAEMVCDSPLSQLVSELPIYYNSKCVLKVSPEKKNVVLLAAQNHAKQMKGKITSVDGVRIDTDGGWAIVRASGTENAIRIFAEAKTIKASEKLMQEFKKVAEEELSKSP